jgi:chromosome segregation ATPase
MMKNENALKQLQNGAQNMNQRRRQLGRKPSADKTAAPTTPLASNHPTTTTSLLDSLYAFAIKDGIVQKGTPPFQRRDLQNGRVLRALLDKNDPGRASGGGGNTGDEENAAGHGKRRQNILYDIVERLERSMPALAASTDHTLDEELAYDAINGSEVAIEKIAEFVLAYLCYLGSSRDEYVAYILQHLDINAQADLKQILERLHPGGRGGGNGQDDDAAASSPLSNVSVASPSTGSPALTPIHAQHTPSPPQPSAAAAARGSTLRSVSNEPAPPMTARRRRVRAALSAETPSLSDLDCSTASASSISSSSRSFGDNDDESISTPTHLLDGTPVHSRQELLQSLHKYDHDGSQRRQLNRENHALKEEMEQLRADFARIETENAELVRTNEEIKQQLAEQATRNSHTLIDVEGDFQDRVSELRQRNKVLTAQLITAEKGVGGIQGLRDELDGLRATKTKYDKLNIAFKRCKKKLEAFHDVRNEMKGMKASLAKATEKLEEFDNVLLREKEARKEIDILRKNLVGAEIRNANFERLIEKKEDELASVLGRVGAGRPAGPPGPCGEGPPGDQVTSVAENAKQWLIERNDINAAVELNYSHGALNLSAASSVPNSPFTWSPFPAGGENASTPASGARRGSAVNVKERVASIERRASLGDSPGPMGTPGGRGAETPLSQKIVRRVSEMTVSADGGKQGDGGRAVGANPMVATQLAQLRRRDEQLFNAKVMTMEEETKTLRAKCESYKEQMMALKEMNDQHSRALEETTALVADNASEVNALRSSLAAKAAALEDVEKQFSASQTRLVTEKGSHDSDVLLLKQSVKDLSARLDAAKKKADAEKNDAIASLSGKHLREKDELLGGHAKEVEALAERHGATAGKLRDEIAGLREQIDGRTELIQGLKADKMGVFQRLKDLERRHDDLKAEAAQNERALRAQLDQAVGDHAVAVERLEQEHRRATKELEERCELSRTESKEKSTLLARQHGIDQTKTVEGLTKEFEKRREAYVSQQRAVHEQLRAELAALRQETATKHQAFAAMATEKQALNGQVSKLAAEKDAFLRERDVMRKACDERVLQAANECAEKLTRKDEELNSAKVSMERQRAASVEEVKAHYVNELVHQDKTAKEYLGVLKKELQSAQEEMALVSCKLELATTSKEGVEAEKQSMEKRLTAEVDALSKDVLEARSALQLKETDLNNKVLMQENELGSLKERYRVKVAELQDNKDGMIKLFESKIKNGLHESQKHLNSLKNDYMRRLAKKDEEMNQLQRSLNERDEAILTKDASLTLLEQKLDESSQSCTSTANALQALTQRHSRLSDDHKRAVAEGSAAKAIAKEQLAAVQDELNRTVEEKDASAAEMERALRAFEDALKRKEVAHETRLESERDKLESARESVEALEGTITDLRDDVVDLKDDVANASRDKEELQDRVEELQDLLKEAEASHAAEAGGMEAKLAAASERAQMQGEEVDRYFAKTLALNAALRDCQAAHDAERRSLAASMEEKDAELSRIEQTLSETAACLAEQKDEYDASLESLTEKDEKLHAVESVLAEKEHAVLELGCALKVKEGTIEGMEESLKRATEGLAQRDEAARMMAADAEGRLQQQRGRVTGLEAQHSARVSSLQAAAAAKEEAIAALQDKVGATEELLGAAKRRAAAAEEGAATSEVQLGVLAAELQTTKSVAASLKGTIDELNHLRGKAKDALVQKEQEISETKVALLKSEMGEKAVARARADLEKELEGARAQLRGQEAESGEKYGAARAELESAKAELGKKVAAYENIVCSKDEELKGMSAINATLTQNLNESRGSLKEKDILLNESKTACGEMSERIQDLGRENSRLTTKLTALTASYEHESKSLKARMNESMTKTRNDQARNQTRQDALTEELKVRIEELERRHGETSAALAGARASHEKEVEKYKKKARDASASAAARKAPVAAEAPAPPRAVGSDDSVAHLQAQLLRFKSISEKTMKSFKECKVSWEKEKGALRTLLLEEQRANSEMRVLLEAAQEGRAEEGENQGEYYSAEDGAGAHYAYGQEHDAAAAEAYGATVEGGEGYDAYTGYETYEGYDEAGAYDASADDQGYYDENGNYIYYYQSYNGEEGEGGRK